TRDIGLLKQFKECTVGVSITTDDDKVKNVFEPFTPPFRVRIGTLKKLKEAGLRTYAFIGPIMPMNAEAVADAVAPLVESAFVDRMNYPHLWKRTAEKNGMGMDGSFFGKTRDELVGALGERGVAADALF
ncbi:MAG: hypothetical protein HY368_02795, partial [Candidatus Aenigmarchaeota archaeon]|nr:hypothetical protein [Candidatus Aenigmarchaeota archaeon]